MKIGERHFVDGQNLVTQETYDPNPILRRAEAMREVGSNWGKDFQPIATFPQFLVKIWMKQHGIPWQDREGMKKMLMGKARDGEWQKLLATSKRI